ncbi:MAG: hypothetical protein J6V50_00390, partial [Clostridia bacterium]|nr:hypothetical protein [Clostridia bacterium]
MFLYLIFSPFINMALSGWQMFSNDSGTEFGEEIHKDIFSEGKLEGYTDSVPSSLIKYPTYGTKYAEITITTGDTVNVIPLYFGDSNPIL